MVRYSPVEGSKEGSVADLSELSVDAMEMVKSAGLEDDQWGSVNCCQDTRMHCNRSSQLRVRTCGYQFQSFMQQHETEVEHRKSSGEEEGRCHKGTRTVGRFLLWTAVVRASRCGSHEGEVCQTTCLTAKSCRLAQSAWRHRNVRSECTTL